MARPRIKAAPADGAACYHTMSRTVNKQFLFGARENEVMRKQLSQAAEFSGVRVNTYGLMSNHFHIVVTVPLKTEIPDEELLRRYRILYPNPTARQTAKIEVLTEHLRTNTPEGQRWRQSMHRRMGDLSEFMKLFKLRYSIWYNRTHNRCGPLWSERFKSVLVQGEGQVLLGMALYVDLNPVMAGIVDDPKDYRYCGYAEALAGSRRAQEGIMAVLGAKSWPEARAHYRKLLFSVATSVRKRGRTLPIEAFPKVIAEGGEIPLTELLGFKLRYFTDGAVLGTRNFVQTHLQAHLARNGLTRPREPRPVPKIAGIEALAVLNNFRGQPIR